MKLLGFDVGSSSVKAALIDAETGARVAAAASPARELPIHSPRPGHAEQAPETWWRHLRAAAGKLRRQAAFDPEEIAAIGIAYQMHGLVVVDSRGRPLRPAIIWCDSRAVQTGAKAFGVLGADVCLPRLLNSPGNFTASKLKWVQENEPELYARIHKAMLPGDYIAMKMTGEIYTTISGLSEQILFDYSTQKQADLLLDYYRISPALLPPALPSFSEQGRLGAGAAAELGLRAGIPVTYRAGDQPNNALSLQVLHPGEVAATAGTSGVVYGVADEPLFDRLSRVNTFVHVNHSAARPRYGTLLCVNGTGILYSWLRQLLRPGGPQGGYRRMNDLAAGAVPGAEGLTVYPYGNGAERTLDNRSPGAAFRGLDFNIHTRAHLLRAAQEGVVFALNFGLDIMRDMGLSVRTVRAGKTNMFLSGLFAEIFAAVTGTRVELYDSDGAQGAARGAGIGAGIFPDFAAAFRGLKPLAEVEPRREWEAVYRELYQRWRAGLDAHIS
jgi:xylulokinase